MPAARCSQLIKSGSAVTGQWVPNKTDFYLVDTNTGATLQSLTVNMQNNAVQGTVTVANLTHPSWGTNFNVGDTLQATVTGAMPYQPVSIDWSSSSKALLGQTDSTGKFVWNYVTKSTDVNSYTEVWDVGGVTVTPALTFLIGQLGGTGTISTTNMGPTPSGHVTGVPTLSITNGVVSTYSATELDYYASLYYDSGSVATLFDNGTQVKQFVASAANGTTTASLTANATAWDDYDLQTDHYVFAFLISGVYYNPLYYGEGSCNDDSGDCSVGSGGGITYYVTVEELYLGSTVADQTNVPQDGSVPTFPDSLYSNFLASASAPKPTVPEFTMNVKAWWQTLVIFGTAIALGEASTGSPQTSRIPFLVELEAPTRGDEYVGSPAQLGEQARWRSYILKDSFGRSWVSGQPVIVAERFSDPVGPGSLPLADGLWYSGFSIPPTQKAQQLATTQFGLEMTDKYGLGLNSATIGYHQYHYAYGFSSPSWLKLPPGLYLPGLPSSLPSATGGPVVPLWIKDL